MATRFAARNSGLKQLRTVENRPIEPPHRTIRRQLVENSIGSCTDSFFVVRRYRLMDGVHVRSHFGSQIPATWKTYRCCSEQPPPALWTHDRQILLDQQARRFQRMQRIFDFHWFGESIGELYCQVLDQLRQNFPRAAGSGGQCREDLLSLTFKRWRFSAISVSKFASISIHLSKSMLRETHRHRERLAFNRYVSHGVGGPSEISQRLELKPEQAFPSGSPSMPAHSHCRGQRIGVPLP